MAAYRQGSWIDRGVMGLSVVGFSVPVFVIGYVLIYVFSLQLGWFPVQGYQRLADGFWGFLQRLILPSLALAIVFIALLARMTRTSVLEVLNEDYVRTARAKGLPNLKVLVCHALRNAAVPIVTVIGISIATLLGGVVVTESVFNIPGLGRLTVDAVLARDYPTVQAVILLFSLAYVLINLVDRRDLHPARSAHSLLSHDHRRSQPGHRGARHQGRDPAWSAPAAQPERADRRARCCC